MLERMGWKEGRGLGVQEEGSIHPIAVRKKDDSLGEILATNALSCDTQIQCTVWVDGQTDKQT